MQNNLLKLLKATIIKVIVAFLFVAVIFALYKVCLENKFETVAGFVKMFAANRELKTLEPVLDGNILLHRPIYGTRYATMKIPSIDVDLPLYYGEGLDLLKNGLGQDSNSYFPGEGGTILCMGHNFKSFLARLPETRVGDKIQIETSYGTFEYTIYQSKIVHETDLSAAPIQQEEEMLIIYTCYPINNIGHAYQRYLVYAK